MKVSKYKMPHFINRLKQKRAQMTAKERRHQSIFLIVMAVLLVFCISSGLKIADEYQQLAALKQEQATLQSKNQQLTTQISGLQKNVAQLKDDTYVEKLAREQYYLSKDGEQIYVIQSGGNTTSSSTESTTQTSTSTSATTTTNE